MGTQARECEMSNDLDLYNTFCKQIETINVKVKFEYSDFDKLILFKMTMVLLVVMAFLLAI